MAQFQFTTGQAESTAGMTTNFWPTQANAGTGAVITLDGGNTLINVPKANELIGTPLIFTVAGVPEPSTLVLALLGLFGLFTLRQGMVKHRRVAPFNS